MKKEIYIGIDKRKIKAVMPSSLFFFFLGVFPNSKRERINRESNWVWSKHRSIFERERERERETCAVNGFEGESGAESRHRLRFELADDFVCFWSQLLHALALQFSFLAVFFFVNLPLQFINLPFFFFFFFLFWVKIKCINYPEFGREKRDESESENE